MIFAVQFFLERWLKPLAIMIEKGKGPVLGILRTIQLVKADMQLIMRIVVKIRSEGNIK